MKNKILITMGLIAALMATGCAGNTGSNAQPEAAPNAETVQAQQETGAEQETAADAGHQNAEPAQEAAAPQIVKYESSEGWNASYNSADIEVIEDDVVYFSYKGDAEGTNQVGVLYYPDQMPDEVLYAAMTTNDEMPEHTRSEGYFAGRTDVWALRTSMESAYFPNAIDDFIAVERNGGTLLLQITTTKQADEAAGIKVSDALAAVVDSFELNDQQPQTYSQYVPGKYVTSAEDGIEGEESAEYYVQFNEDHTGVIRMQDEIPVIWYSRDGKVLNAESGEQIYEYNVEGDSLYLTDPAVEDAEPVEFMRESGENTAEAKASAVNYAEKENWVYYGVGDDRDVDLFLVCPTVDTLDEENMSLENEVMKEYFGGEEMQDRLVAAYAIGWACTEDMVKEYPQIKPAQSADDLGVVISFDCEAPEVTETVVNPAGQKAYSINPLNWKTDSTPADKSENIGSRFMKSNGKIIGEYTGLCGCYIDEERGVLKVTDVDPADYPAVLDIFPEGAYHIYDYQFFFMNLQENVQNRVELYMEQAAAADQAA